MLFTVDIMPAGVSGIPVMGGHSVHYVSQEVINLAAVVFDDVEATDGSAG